ncbi:NAD(P)-dependent glycerol-3-phosphate dehydrogenase [candidate division KSB1 bacterium]|nr:NAD(P)-dependent glycerol-3-phosphate dehydrogenase [candidate division KSB1 bacterium]
MKSSDKHRRITILGAGSWGIALALYCDRIGHSVTLWEYDPVAAQKLHQTRKRELVIPGVILPDSIAITSDLDVALTECELVFLVVPSHVARTVMEQIAALQGKKEYIFISCIKGIENESLMRISEIVHSVLTDFDPARFAVLSGPSHAEEVSRNIPTAVVIASTSAQTASVIQKSLTSKTFRFYTSQDIAGVELGGALKNVIAIAAGICDGAGFGDNTKAALQPRGLAEIARLGQTLGANPLTFSGLSGMGDLIVTCMSRHSRNRFVGEQIGQGKTLKKILESMAMVAEGVRTCRSAVELGKKNSVELPICQEVYRVLFEKKSPKAAVDSLMSRAVKPEVY